MILQVSELSLAFGEKKVLNQCSFELEQGEIACLLGQSGCGKTTILRCIAGFETAQSGEIILNGQKVFSNQNNTPAHRRKIGMVFQDYALFPHLTVAENIAFGLKDLNKTARQARVAELLQLIDLKDYEKQYPHQLSGGQQQRVALARALAPKPDLILLDEPFSSLDADLRTHLAKEIRTLLKQEKTSAIMVTHDQHEAFAMADKIGMMSMGYLHQWATPTELYLRPKTMEVAKFVGVGVVLKGKVESPGCLKTALGTNPYFQSDVPTTHEVQVLVRPEHLRLVATDQSDIHAQVLTKQFVGSYFDYTLACANGETVRVYAHLSTLYEVGDTVGVLVENSSDWVIFP